MQKVRYDITFSDGSFFKNHTFADGDILFVNELPDKREILLGMKRELLFHLSKFLKHVYQVALENHESKTNFINTSFYFKHQQNMRNFYIIPFAIWMVTIAWLIVPGFLERAELEHRIPFLSFKRPCIAIFESFKLT